MKINMPLSRTGILSMFQMSEDVANTDEQSVLDVDETYLGLLMHIYRNIGDMDRSYLRPMFPITTRELDVLMEPCHMET